MKNVLLAGIALVACATFASSAPEETARRPRTDRYGDPLPEGAIARLGTLRLRGCRGPVVFSPDGKYVVAPGGDWDSQAVFWDVATGRRVKALTAKGNIAQLAFSPEGKYLAAAGDADFFNLVWDVTNGKEVFTFKGREVTFSADGKQLVSIGDVPIKARIYNSTDGKQQSEWSLTPSRKFTLSADGRFAVAPLDGAMPSIGVFDLRKKVKAKHLPVSLEYWGRGDFSRDGRRLVASGTKGWTVWDWASGKSLRTWSGRIYRPPAFSPDGRRLAWISPDRERPSVGYLWVVDLGGGQPRCLGLMDSIESPNTAAFSNDGKKLAITTQGNALALVDSRTGRDLLALGAHTGRIDSVAYFSDGRYLVTRDSLRLLVWEAATGRLLHRLPDDWPKSEIVLLNTASRGRVVTAELPDGILRLRDLVTGKELRRLQDKDGIIFALGDTSAVSSDGTSAAVLSLEGVCVYDLDKGTVHCRFIPEDPIWGMDFSADGRTLILALQDPPKGFRITFRDARTGRKIKPPAGTPPLLDPNVRWLRDEAVTKAWLRRLRLLDKEGHPAFMDEGEFITDFTDIRESPSGHYLAVQGRISHRNRFDVEDKSFLRIWDRSTRRLIADIDPKHQHQLGLFSPDERTFLSTNWTSGTIYLWEMATGRERLRLQGHMPAGDVQFALRPDGRVLVSGGDDTQVFLWDITGRAPDGVWRGTHHSPEQLRQLWGDLAGEDATRAYRAIWSLVAAPPQAVALIQKHLHPVASVGPQRLARLLADLDSDSFTVRSQATQELERLGELAEPSLRKTRDGRPTLEVRRRCGELLDKLSVLSGGRLQAVRAVEVLEHLGTVEARRLLEKLAQGDPAARLTREAQAALKRVTANRSLQGGG